LVNAIKAVFPVILNAVKDLNLLKIRDSMILRLILFLTLTLTGCATYHPMPLDKAAVARALAPPALATIPIKAKLIHHPLLRPVNFDLRHGLSPDEVAILAVIANPKLRALRDRKGLAQAQLLQVGILPNPTFSYSLDLPMAGATEGTVKAYGLGLNYDIRSLITHAAKVAAAQNQAAAVDLDVAWQEWQVAQGARLHLLRLAILNRQLAVARKEEQGLRENVANLRQALNRGYVTIISLSAAQATLQKVHTQLLTIAQQQAEERLALNAALGLPPDQPIPIAAPLNRPPPPLPTLKELMHGIQTRRLDLLALKMGYQSQEERLREAILAQIPKITIGFLHASDTTHVITTGFNLAIDLPIFDRNQGRIAIARATRQQLFDEYVSRLFTARADVARLLTAMASVRRQIKSVQAAIVTLKNLVQVDRRALLEGHADVLTYFNARDQLISQNLALLTLKGQLADQTVALEIAAGAYLD
jgi:cobalt-zinc-cadmium efflux system outer membrane protein